ncbi:endonuclease NucS [Halobaculum magnesiiphilum]|uniref:Endonuclease NucS n=1 Tax=Halobaculum magnesiiphilum TaxID=1017351 RepID=A0A8T8WBS1_9EURY|nr:endonuclease NucS [Halobaculum magnesiiphilum]QZP37290.1 endonuclease NucS [Halobaculum magnesiiphilum]
MTATTLHEPAHREALWELEAAFDRGDLVTLFGTCTVEYDGRAASSLGPGARLLVLKPDGSALVHTDEGRTPVNWQPPGCEHRAAVRDGRLRVRSVRTSPAETLDVRFSAVDQLAAYGVTGGRSVEVVGSEADLKRRVLDDPELVEPGFEPLATERASDAGPIDVFGRDAEGRPVVVELKRRRVGPDAAGQLARYVNAVEREEPDGTEVRGVLLAPSITDRARDLLDDEGLEHVAAGPPEGDAADDPAGDDA